MPRRVSNSDTGDLAADTVEFINTNKTLYGKWLNDSLYVVYSYGAHWPLYVYLKASAQWFGNQDRYSVTTSQHRHQVMPCPHNQIHWDSKDYLDILINLGQGRALT